MRQKLPAIVPNLYTAYDTARQSGVLDHEKAFAQVIHSLLAKTKFRGYSYERPLTANADGSLTANISTGKEGNIGQITFKVNEEIQEIETTYSNELLEKVFQPLFTTNYYIHQSALVNADHLRHTQVTQSNFRDFYKSPESLQFAAKIEEIHHLYEQIKQRTPKLQTIAIGNQKILDRDFFGQVRENEKNHANYTLDEQEKIIAAINEIAQENFFRTLPTHGLDPNNSDNMTTLSRRLQILNHLCDILSNYSRGTAPNKNKISALRLAVKALNEPNNHGESETQRTVTAIGMTIGIPAFIASIVLIALLVTLPVAPLWMSIGIPVLFFAGGLIGGWSALGFHFSFPQGIAKDLYFIADKMEAEFNKHREGTPDGELDAPGVKTDSTPGLTSGLTPGQTQVARESFEPLYPPNTKKENETPEAKELHRLLEAACKDLDDKEHKYLLGGLDHLLNTKYDFEAVKKEIEEAKQLRNHDSRFSLLCLLFNLDPRMQNQTHSL